MQVSVVPHPKAVAPDVDDVTVMDEPVDQRRRHHVVAEDLAPFLEALVRGQHGGCVFVATGHELKEEHRPRASDGEVADLIDDQQRPTPSTRGASALLQASSPALEPEHRRVVHLEFAADELPGDLAWYDR